MLILREVRLVADAAGRSTSAVLNQSQMVTHDVGLPAARRAGLLIVCPVADADFANFLVADRLDGVGVMD